MPFRLREIIGFLDETLEVAKFRDYAPNGLQVEGATTVNTVITGVSANAALIEHAIERNADLIVVHHGLIWGSGIPTVTGTTARRLRPLLANDISLAAYHLPLDKHARLGNNTGMADAIGLTLNREAFGDVRGVALGLAGAWTTPLTRDEAIARIGAGCCAGQVPRFVFPYGPATVRKVGLCSGAASDMIEAAANAGCDVFVTGELAERASELARELQITLVAAGHHATEVFGAQRLVGELQMRFAGLRVEFVDVPNPV